MWAVEAVGTQGINIFWVGDQGYIGLKQFVFKGGSPHLFPVLDILTRAASLEPLGSCCGLYKCKIK